MIFVRQGKLYLPTDRDIEQLPLLPAGNYLVKFNEVMKQYYLEHIESFTEPMRIYGDVEKIADRILRTYAKRKESTGVVLSGDKGSGKTLTAKMCCIIGARSKIPTIIVSTPYHGEEFNTFIQGIEQPMIVLFDEFEKVYESKHQESLLTLLDGVFPTKKLFIMTCNDKYRIDTHMRNRPGRIFYAIEFGGVSKELVAQYCQHNLENKENIPGVQKVISVFEEFNFDMLQALVEEMNRYDEKAIDAMKYLNAKPQVIGRESFDAKLEIDAKPPREFQTTVYFDPLKTSSFSIWYKNTVKGELKQLEFSMSDLVTINGETLEYIYRKPNVELILSRKKQENFDFKKHGKVLEDGTHEGAY